MAVKQTFTSRAQELLSDLDKMNKLLGTQVKKFEEISPAAQRMERAVDKAFEQRKDGDKFVRMLKELRAQLKAGTITQDQYTAAVRRTLRTMRDTDKAQRSAFGPRALQQVTSLVGGYLSVQGVLALITSEMEKQKQLREEQTQAQLTVAQAEQNFRQNTFFLAPDEREKFLADVKAVATDSNLPQAQILEAGKAVFSGVGDQALTIDLLKTAAGFTRDPEALRAIAGGLGDIAFTTGKRDPKELLGFLTITQGAARLEETTAVGRQVGKVAAAFTAPNAGTDAETGAALFAALSRGTADPTGELSRTASINIIDRLDKFFKEDDVAKRFKPDEIDTTNERLALTRGAALGKEFVESDSFAFRAATKGGVSKFFLGDETLNRDFESTRAKLSDRDQLRASAIDALDFVNAGSLAGTAQAELAVASGFEGFALGNEAPLTQESRRKIISLAALEQRQLLTSANIDFFTRTGSTLSRGEAIEQIERVLSTDEISASKFVASDEEQASARAELRNILTELKQINANQRGGRVSPRGQAE